MLERMLRTFVPNYTQTGDPAVRERYGVLAGAVGILLNLLLFAGKLLAGIVTGAISVTADAFNNLSDAASSVVTLAGFRLAGQKADAHHPFGHGVFGWTAGFPDDFIGGSGAGEKLYWQDPSPGGDGADRPHRGHPGLRCGGEAVDGVV